MARTPKSLSLFTVNEENEYTITIYFSNERNVCTEFQYVRQHREMRDADPVRRQQELAAERKKWRQDRLKE